MGLKLYKKYEISKDCFKVRLKEQRKKVYKRQEDFADALHTKVETVRNWEQGRTVPETGTLIEICLLLNCDLDYLIGRIDYKTHDVQFIHDQTGLSQSAIEQLQKWNMKEDKDNNWAQNISDFIVHDSFPELMNEVSGFKGLRKLELRGYEKLSSSDLIELIDLEMARLWHISKVFTDIVESMDIKV